MQIVVALLAAVVLCAVPASAQAQELLSGDSPTPWGYGWSPNGASYQPTPAQSYVWTTYPQTSPWAWNYPSYPPAPTYWPRAQAAPAQSAIAPIVDDIVREAEIRRTVRSEMNAPSLWPR